MAVVVAVTGLLAIAVAAAVFQVLQGTIRNRDHMAALRRVQQAGYWVGRDVLMAQTVVTGDDAGTPELEFVTLEWTDWSQGDKHSVVYTLEDMGGGSSRLARRYVIVDGSGTTVRWDRSTLVVEGVTAATLSEGGGVWLLSVAARVGRQTESAQYTMRPRIDI